MSNFLENLEAKLQSLFEGSLDRLLYPGAAVSLTTRLIQLIDDKLKSQDGGIGVAPDRIEILVSPERLDAWHDADEALKLAAQEIERSWTEQGYSFRSSPRITVGVSETLLADKVEVLTGFSPLKADTAATALQSLPRADVPASLPNGAYFIINGKDQVRLDKPLVNVGRRSTSDVQVNDPMVSRDHLQLRAQNGRYLLFDLSSTGGTYINNKKLRSAFLKPGDVIRIGKTILIYNHDLPAALPGTRSLLIDGDKDA